MGYLSSTLTQIFPPKPGFTEKDLPDLQGKVYIVSGANAGLGKELARMLYSKNGRVYMAARSEAKAKAAIEEIKASAAPSSSSKGSLVYMHLDLNDLSTIKASVAQFLATETKLHVLFNNAGVMSPAKKANDSRTAQGYEIHMGVNGLGTFLFTKLLTPILVSTARDTIGNEPSGTVRVVWVSSSGTEMWGTKNSGVRLDNLDYSREDPDAVTRYGFSKAVNYLHGVEFARRFKADGVVSIPLNPGNLGSSLQDNMGIGMRIAIKLSGYPPVNGAYTELFAGLSPEITLEKSGSWVVPFGRILPIRSDLLNAMKSEAEGGTDSARKLWEWTEDQVRPYL